MSEPNDPRTSPGGTIESGGNGAGNGSYPGGEPQGVRDAYDKGGRR